MTYSERRSRSLSLNSWLSRWMRSPACCKRWVVASTCRRSDRATRTWVRASAPMATRISSCGPTSFRARLTGAAAPWG